MSQENLTTGTEAYRGLRPQPKAKRIPFRMPAKAGI